jgi:ubiquinone/menaquinone biosynthesis C-methylase UbiE
MNCDAIAGAYRWMEYAAFGKALERCRCSLLDHLGASRRALVLGDGDGRFLAAFASRHPAVTIDYVDVSGAMLKLAQRRLHSKPDVNRSRIQFHRTDVRILDWQAPHYDLIACHFFFDVFAQAELADVLRRISQAAIPRAKWLVSEFDLPPARLRRAGALILLRIMYGFFRLATGLANQELPEWRPLLESHGFSREASSSERGGFIVSELWARNGCIEPTDGKCSPPGAHRDFGGDTLPVQRFEGS